MVWRGRGAVFHLHLIKANGNICVIREISFSFEDERLVFIVSDASVLFYIHVIGDYMLS